jgi:hypothetical protein
MNSSAVQVVHIQADLHRVDEGWEATVSDLDGGWTTLRAPTIEELGASLALYQLSVEAVDLAKSEAWADYAKIAPRVPVHNMARPRDVATIPVVRVAESVIELARAVPETTEAFILPPGGDRYVGASARYIMAAHVPANLGELVAAAHAAVKGKHHDG